MNLRLNANAIITNNHGQILIIKLKKGPFAGGYCIPGGGINPGELSFETIKREIKVETGLEIKKSLEPFGFCELIHYGKKDHRVVLLLKGKGNGALKETEEGSPEWASAEGIEKKLIPFAREAVKIWKEGKNHFKLLDEECLPSWCL